MIMIIYRKWYSMRILLIGDIVSSQGCEHLRKTLPALKREYKADVVIANGENSAVGNGVTPHSAKYIFDSGVDVITLGNHSLRRREIYNYLEETEFIIRPANYHASAPGKGVCVVDKGYTRLGVINLQGVMYLENHKNPFEIADREIKVLNDAGVRNIIIDFHAEASSEKKGLGFYVDGRVSAVVGTHTHVQTSDEQILPCGTGYITDLGMTGPYYSVLGITPECAIEKMKTNLPVKFTTEDGPCTMEGCFVELDDKTGKAVNIERFRK